MKWTLIKHTHTQGKSVLPHGLMDLRLSRWQHGFESRCGSAVLIIYATDVNEQFYSRREFGAVGVASWSVVMLVLSERREEGRR